MGEGERDFCPKGSHFSMEKKENKGQAKNGHRQLEKVCEEKCLWKGIGSVVRTGKDEGGFKDRNEFSYQHETSANLEFSCLSLLKGPGLGFSSIGLLCPS